MSRYILKSIHMTLDPGSIDNAIREVEKFRKQLQPAMQYLMDYLGQKGVEFARAELYLFDDPAIDTGALSESMNYRQDGDNVVVVAGEGLMDGYSPPQSYAVYVEYGTGIYGTDVNDHGFNGWWYPAPWGWWTPKEGKHAGEKMAWTVGMPPRPFMAHTMYRLEDEARAAGAKIIAEYIRGEHV